MYNTITPYSVPNAVFKSAVWCCWIHVTLSTYLFDVTKSLKLRSIDDGNQKRVELNIPVYGIAELLNKLIKVYM